MHFEHVMSSLHIIESTKEGDKEPGKALQARLLQKGEALPNLPIRVHQVFGADQLHTVLDEILLNETSEESAPILHFEFAHGNEEELQLRSDETITWIRFADQLARFNLATRFNLLAVLSCCHGYQQIDALDVFKVSPFTALVGCVGEISTTELLDSFERFYCSLLTERNIARAVKEMRTGLRPGTSADFGLVTAARMFRAVIEAAYRDNEYSESYKKIKREQRRKAELINALNGNLTPISDALAERAEQESLDRELRRYHACFFAIDKVPENAAKFCFEDFATDARKRIKNDVRKCQ